MQIRCSITAFILTAVITTFVGVPATVAQRSGKTMSGSKRAGNCSGAWTGSITYRRTQADSHHKVVERVSGRGTDTTDWNMKYEYSARVMVKESAVSRGQSEGIAKIRHSMSSKETVEAVEKNSCDRGKTWRDMRGNTTSETQTNGSAAVDANVSIGVNTDGTYTVSVALPRIKGTSSGSQNSKYSGQCTPKEGKDLTMPASETSIDGNSLSSDGSDRIDAKDPNRLSGSFTRSWQGVTETLSWNLQKCGAPLRIADIKFQDMKFPKWGEWQEISEQKGTVDGNLVRIKATVVNLSGEEKYANVKLKETFKGDKWDGARPDGLLPGGEVSVRLEPGEEREVELVWDSSGYSWFDDGRPRLLQRIKAELEENGSKTDEMIKNLKVAPKPLVLVHGLWSNWKAWETWQNILTTTHSYDWKAFAVGEKADKGVMNTGGEFLSTERTNSVFENSQQLGRYIRYAQEDRNAWHVDVVAHSMGGLITRHYIHQFMPPAYQDGKPQISHLVMLGTPNMGSPCADVMDLAFGVVGKNVEAIRELRRDVAADFNRVNVDRKGVRFSVLAGDPLPVMCKTAAPNDGVVTTASAYWNVSDKGRTSSVHTDLTGTGDFSNFVRPRLAIGPKGVHTPDVQVPQLPVFKGHNGEFRQTEMFGGGPNTPDEQDQVFAKAVTLAPGETLMVDVPVTVGPDLGITFMAAAGVSVELLDAAGVSAGKNEANVAAANGIFRGIYVPRPTNAGVWKLKMTNHGKRIAEVVATRWNRAVP